jgi:large conductance mechanosensitive channel
MFQEFKAFLMRGNILDMAVGVILGAAFTKVVTSLTSDLVMPLIGQLAGKMDFSNLFVDLSGSGHRTLIDAKAAGAATINYGVFINTLVDFVIVAFAVYLLLKVVNRAIGRRDPIAPPKP